MSTSEAEYGKAGGRIQRGVAVAHGGIEASPQSPSRLPRSELWTRMVG